MSENMNKKVEVISEIVKHLPGQHDQASHAGPGKVILGGGQRDYVRDDVFGGFTINTPLTKLFKPGSYIGDKDPPTVKTLKKPLRGISSSNFFGKNVSNLPKGSRIKILGISKRDSGYFIGRFKAPNSRDERDGALVEIQKDAVG